MYQQRAAIEPAPLRGPWRPAIDADEPPDFQPADRYVVVDDIETGRAVVVVSPWPNVDELGHLLFDEDAAVRHFSLAEAQEAVNDAREQAGQPAPDRPLRVGDVFWVRADSVEDAGSLAAWRILDITRAARSSARAALLMAASPGLRTPQPRTVEREAQVELEPGAEGQEPPPAGSARPAV